MNSANESLLQFLRRQSVCPKVSSQYQSSQTSKRSSFSKQDNDQFRTPTKNILRQNFGRQQYSSPHFSTVQSNFTFSPFQYGNSVSDSLSESRSYDDFEQQKYETRNYRNPEIERSKVNQSVKWPRRESEYSIFQSEKHSSVQVLQRLQSKLRNQIESITKKINEFNSRAITIINEELQSVKQKIYKMVEDMFKDSDRYVQQYIRDQERSLTEELIYMRTILQTEYVKIEQIRQEMNRSNWQQVARYIDTNHLQKKIDSLMLRSSIKQIGKWPQKDLFNSHMKAIEQSLVNIMKFKERQ